MGFWDFFWLLIWSYCLFAYLILLFHVFADLFRDRQLGGFAKGLWARNRSAKTWKSSIRYANRQ